MKTSLQKNFFYKGLLTLATPLMGMITFPYISRILGVEAMGLLGFVDNTISYFLLFAMMGIGTLGVRAIAAVKDSQDQLNKTFSNILGLNFLFTAVTIGIFILLVTVIPKFNVNKELFYIGASRILFSSLLIEWFFNGLEDFKYITIRSLWVKFIYVISVFVFIRNTGDYKLYFIITTLTVVINAVINLIYSRRFVRIIPKELISGRFLKENITLGIYGLMTSMYLTFNVMYLGLASNSIQVGYYTSAFKLYHIILSIFSAYTSVMLPRMSALQAKDDQAKFRNYVYQSTAFVALFSIPLIVCSSIMSPEIIYILCGNGYEGAITPMRIIMPAVLFVAIAQVIAVQVLMPLKKDKVLLCASISGAIISLMINIIFVPRLQSIGSAIVLILSEFFVTLIYVIYIETKGIIKLNYKIFIWPVLKTLPCVAVCLSCQKMVSSPYLSLTLAIIISVVLYALLNIYEIKRLIYKNN